MLGRYVLPQPVSAGAWASPVPCPRLRLLLSMCLALATVLWRLLLPLDFLAWAEPTVAFPYPIAASGLLPNEDVSGSLLKGLSAVRQVMSCIFRSLQVAPQLGCAHITRGGCMDPRWTLASRLWPLV